MEGGRTRRSAKSMSQPTAPQEPAAGGGQIRGRRGKSTASSEPKAKRSRRGKSTDSSEPAEAAASTEEARRSSAEEQPATHVEGGMKAPSEPATHAEGGTEEASSGRNDMILSTNLSQSNDVDPDDSKEGNSMYQCSPVSFYDEVLKELKKEEKFVELIKKIQYHNLFGMKPVKLKKKVIKFLVKCFDEKSRVLVINEQPIDIKPLVQKILGLPNCGLDVIFYKKYKGDPELRKMLSDGKGKSVYAARALHLMGKEGLDERTLCILFILQACAHYLAPKANRNVEREFLSFFKNVSTPDQIKNMKWCDFFADFLIEGLVRYKTSTAKTRKCWGCVHILAVIFYDFVTPDAEITDKQFPRINHITQDDLNTLARVDLDELSKKVKPLNQTVYKEDYRVGEVARPELTGHSNDTVADASMNSQPSLSLLQGQLLFKWISDLELKVSAVPEEEANMIKHLKDKASDESYKSDLARFEEHLNAERASITNEVKQKKKLLADLLKVPEN